MQKCSDYIGRAAKGEAANELPVQLTQHLHPVPKLQGHVAAK